jgi:CBS domain containing-hemolysin-like protein
MEAVLLSLPISYLKSKSEQGDKSVKAMIKFKDDVDKPLSAILSLNTVAHTVGAAGVGAEATKVFGEAYFGVVSAVLTILILVFTEIIPKTLGANYNKALLKITTRLIQGTIFLTYPLVWVSSLITKIISKKGSEPTTSREEISALASIGVKEGIFKSKENAVIQNIIKLKSLKIEEIMTPRIVVETADEDMTLQEFYDLKDKLMFSRIPVYSHDKDNITGYVRRQQVFEHIIDKGNDGRLKDIKRDILKFPEETTLFDAWETMIHSKEHISIIQDTYGGLNGIVTFEDILESLLGIEIVDETDKEVDMQEYALKKWKNRQLGIRKKPSK